MKKYSTEMQAIEHCMKYSEVAIAHLTTNVSESDMHIHDCFELHYFVSGGKNILIDQHFYAVEKGDIFFINPFEGHSITLQANGLSEQIIFYIHPDYLASLSTPCTNLAAPFCEKKAFHTHKLSLNTEQQNHFLQGFQKMAASHEHAKDIYQKSAFLELMAMLYSIFYESKSKEAITPKKDHHQIYDILSYINAHIKETISIDSLAEHFYLSESYICRLFKSITGTTINKYITIRRIADAKKLLADDYSVAAACEQCGFSDYSNFFKAFTKAVGCSPKKYTQSCHFRLGHQATRYDSEE